MSYDIFDDFSNKRWTPNIGGNTTFYMKFDSSLQMKHQFKVSDTKDGSAGYNYFSDAFFFTNKSRVNAAFEVTGLSDM